MASLITPYSAMAWASTDEEAQLARATDIRTNNEDQSSMTSSIPTVELQQQLLRSEETLRLACEGANAGIWRRDVASGKEIWSPKYYELYGFSADTVPSFKNWLAAVHPDDRDLVTRDHERILNGQLVELANEFRVLHPNGIRWVREIGRNYFDVQGNLTEMVGIALDITMQKEHEQKILRTAERKDDFLSMIAHELRNSLSVIVSGLNLAKKGNKPAEWTDRLIRDKVKSLTRLIGDLLDLARLTEGKVTLNRQLLQVHPLIQEILRQAKILFHDKQLKFSTRAAIEPLQLNVDPIRFEQMLTNLVHNACKYTPAGGTVQVEIRDDGEWIAIAVHDSGIGIAPESLDAVFELYTQLNKNEPSNRDPFEAGSAGLGIGLSVVQQLVTMHGGSVNAESKGLNQGATFTLRFSKRDAVFRARQAEAVIDFQDSNSQSDIS